MSDFTVKTNQIKRMADILEKQADELERASEQVDTIRTRLSIQGTAKGSVMSAMRATSGDIHREAVSASNMGRALRQIAEKYREAEKQILLMQPAGSGGGNSGGGGGGGHTGGSRKGFDRSSSEYSADPVNLNTGNFILDNHDIEIPGFQPFVLGRFYNSMDASTGMLGDNWTTSFEVRFFPQKDPLHPNESVVIREDGREESFWTADGGVYVSSGNTSELRRTEDGYAYQTLEGNRYLFDKAGKYVRFENTHHLGFDLIYKDGLLARVEKDTGEYFAFSYGEDGLLSQVEDPEGRTCQYQYSGGHLSKVVLPDGNAYEYFYHPSGKICRVLNPRKVDAVETEYDDKFRVTYQRFADGTTNRFAYNDMERSVTMTERNGSESIHYHDEKYQNVRNVFPDGEERFTYNELGLKTSVVDKRGNTTHFQYDNKGNVTEILLPDHTKVAATYNQQNKLLTVSINGIRKVRNQYNSLGDRVSTEDGLGRKTEFSYDTFGRVTAVHYPSGESVFASYDERGNLTECIDANGGKTHFAYDAQNQVIQRTDPLGRTHAYAYDMMGRVVSETRADGQTKQYQYDAWGNLVSETDYDGGVKTTVYNENNKPTRVIDAAGREIQFAYDSMWNLAKVILPNGGVFQYCYDENNRLTTVCDAEGNETTYAYDPMGNVLSKTDAEGATTHYVWDTNGRCTQVTTADGAVTQLGYDEEDHVIFVKDAEGVVRYRTFDAAGQLVSEKDSLGSERIYSYSESGDLLSVLDELGRRTSYRYAKGLHEIEEVLYPDGTREHFTYDQNGNVLTHTDRDGVLQHYAYDLLDRLAKITTQDGHSAEYVYDLLGRLLSEKDLLGNVTKYEYSPTGQLLAVVDALGNRTSYTYDAMGELAAVLREDPSSGNTFQMQYERDRMGRITKLVDALGETETYRYNGIGRITEKTDREGLLTKYAYNCLGLLSGIQWADGKETAYQYNLPRRLCKIEDWTGETYISYDKKGYLTQILYPDQRSLDISYDGQGNRTKVCYPDGKEVSYAYNDLGQMVRLEQGELTIHCAYQAQGRLALRSTSDGSQVYYEYDDQGKLSRVLHTDGQGTADDFSFGYDALGRRNRYVAYRRDLSAENGAYTYSYDPVGRLAQVCKDGCAIRSYTYDAFGNRKSLVYADAQDSHRQEISYEHDLRGGLIRMMRGDVQEEYKYDRRGNLTEQIRNGSSYRQYRYNAMNRLAQTQSADNGNAVYQYNGLGYRIGMTTAQQGKETAVRYVLDYSKIYDNLLEKQENGQTESYLWGDRLEGFATGAASGWYLTDAQGSVLRKVTASQTLFAEHYDEFGIPSGGMDQWETFGYTGYQFDPIAGTYYAQARQYRSDAGMFDAMDRIAGDITWPDTMNPYAYCIQDPLNHTDKSGYWCLIDDVIAAGVGAIGSMASTFVGDLITSACNGDFELSSWKTYLAAGIGGAAGGVASLYGTPVVGGAVGGAVTKLVEEGLDWATDPDGYQKSAGEVVFDVASEAASGALFSWATEWGSKAFGKFVNSKAMKGFISKLEKGGKVKQWMADWLTGKAHGKPSTLWDQVMSHSSSRHGANGGVAVLKDGIPIRLWEAALFAVLEGLGESLWDVLTGWMPETLKKWLGIGDSGAACPAAA